MRRGFWVGAVALLGGGIALLGSRSLLPNPAPPAAAQPAVPMLPPAPTAAPDEEGADELHGFRPPTGEPTAVPCEAARAIVAQVRRHMAYEPTSPSPIALADGTVDWLDPHGLWSAAPDAPVATILRRRARELLHDLEGRGPTRCGAAREAGEQLARWVGSLRREFEKHRGEGTATDPAAPADAVFENGPVSRPARDLVGLLGDRVGATERLLGPAAQPYADSARARFFPELDAEGWSRVVLAAAVRAYVPLIDPHGAWAPADEEASIYEVDLEAAPPERLWEKAVRTAVGVRIDSGPIQPLESGDVLLALGGIATAGLSLEQVDQLALAVADGKTSPTAVVLRSGDTKPITLTLSLHGRVAPVQAPAPPADLASERVKYGNGDVLVVVIPDVHDNLGEELAHVLGIERRRGELEGVVLDLRGDGGGSTDGAIAALGLFLPGAPLFPMKRRDGTMETDRAPEPPANERWDGPVATFVDRDTASAAEMIAGALMAYRRGPSVGTSTFGKGCAQEYLDDDANAGVLRLTTLLYALPDGSPVQRVGLVPTYRFSFIPVASDGPREREAHLPNAPPRWRGPDVRDPTLLAKSGESWSSPWRAHGGVLGPCKNADVCRALRLLGTAPPARRVSSIKGR